MTAEQFVYWLKGRVAANSGPPRAMAWAEIVAELGGVTLPASRGVTYTPLFGESPDARVGRSGSP